MCYTEIWLSWAFLGGGGYTLLLSLLLLRCLKNEILLVCQIYTFIFNVQFRNLYTLFYVFISCHILYLETDIVLKQHKFFAFNFYSRTIEFAISEASLLSNEAWHNQSIQQRIKILENTFQ